MHCDHYIHSKRFSLAKEANYDDKTGQLVVLLSPFCFIPVGAGPQKDSCCPTAGWNTMTSGCRAKKDKQT